MNVWTQQGVLGALIVAIGTFFYFGLWPWVKHQWELARLDRREDQRQFMAALKTQSTGFEKVAKSLDRLTLEVRVSKKPAGLK